MDRGYSYSTILSLDTGLMYNAHRVGFKVEALMALVSIRKRRLCSGDIKWPYFCDHR